MTQPDSAVHSVCFPAGEPEQSAAADQMRVGGKEVRKPTPNMSPWSKDLEQVVLQDAAPPRPPALLQGEAIALLPLDTSDVEVRPALEDGKEAPSHFNPRALREGRREEGAGERDLEDLARRPAHTSGDLCRSQPGSAWQRLREPTCPGECCRVLVGRRGAHVQSLGKLN